MSSDEEARRKLEKPQCTAAQVIAFVRTAFHLPGGDIDESSAKELNSYDDRNYHVCVADGTEYTLKVHNGVESQMPSLLAAQSSIMRHLNANGVPAPLPIRPTTTTTTTTTTSSAANAAAGDPPERDWMFLELPLKGGAGGAVDGDATRRHAVRVLTWVPGVIAEQSETVKHTREFMRSIGAFVGKISNALESFHHPGADRWHLWDNANVLSVRELASAVEDPSNRATTESVLRDFEEKVLPSAKDLRRGVLQNDANDQNVIVRDVNGDGIYVPVGLLDFGDMLVSWRVNDVAISLAYFMLGKEDPVGDAAVMLAGFESTFPLTDLERRLLPTLIAARLVCSCVCGAYSAAADPANKEYLLLTQKPGWAALNAIREAGDEECLRRFAEAAVAAVGDT